MIAKIHELKRTTTEADVKSLCETTIAAMSSAIYNAVTPEARFEIERVATENLFEGLAKFPKDKLISEWLGNQKRLYSIKNIGVRAAISSLKENEAKVDPTLYSFLQEFEEKTQGTPEALIYEEFISAMAGEYNWVPGVHTQLDALKARVSQYKADIDITKIIETMKLTRSNYLLPLIEDVVNNYLANKTEQTKSHLKETLVKFSYDPFIHDIINIVMLDAKDLQLEYSNTEVAIDKVYSPLKYLGENEVAFNIKGTFYIKKGNNVNRLKVDEAMKLDENFRALCEAVNLPNVEVGRKDITVYVGNDKAVINEDSVEINTHVMNEQELYDAAEIAQWTGSVHFYKLTETLQKNFNEIVEIDFAKRVYMKTDEAHAADIMKLRENIYVTTYDPTNNKVTFYRNINSIQAEKVMMEHMRFDVSGAFADILPNKEKILSKIEENKKEYVAYIAKLNEQISEFKESEAKEAKKVISLLEEELREVKSEYKDYVNSVEEYISVAEGTTVTIDVDGEKYTVPIPQKDSVAKGEETEQSTGTVIGAEHMESEPASEITFQDDQTELLGDSPSMQADTVDLGVDNVEAQADAAEAGAEGEEEEGAEDGEGAEGGEAESGEEDMDLGAEEGGEDLGDEEAGDEGEDELGLGDEEETEEGEEEEWKEEKDISEEGDNDEEAVEAEEITLGEPDVEEEVPQELEASEEGGEDEVEVEDVDVKERDPKAPRVFLRKKVQENLNESHLKSKAAKISFICKHDKKCKKEEVSKLSNKEIEKKYLALEKKMGIKESVSVKKNLDHKVYKVKNLNEDVQVGDTVTVKGKKGYVIGQMGDGDFLVQVQYSTVQAKPSEVKPLGKKPEILTKPQYKFDKTTLQNLTTKALFEQYVKCGIYMGSTPVKVNDCYVMFNEWNDATDEKPVAVLAEGQSMLFPKDQIRILENINEFGNPDNYIQGAVIDEETEQILENVLINIIDFTAAIGDSDEVRIVRLMEGKHKVTSAPVAILRTLN